MATNELPSTSLRERVTARLHTLTATEQRVATYLAAHPQEAVFASAEQLGRATGTSDASVVRTAKALGYDGLPGLKRSLQGDVEALLTPAKRLHNSLSVSGEGAESVLAATLADRVDLINRVDRELDRGAFGRAVELTAGANEILVCGLAALVVAEHTANRLTRIGRRARHIADVGVRLAHQLASLGPDDLVLAVAQNRPAHEMRVVLEHAQRVGAKSVLVTETLGEALRDKVDVLIKVPQGAPEMFGSQMGTFIVLEALTMAVAAKDEERSLRALTTVSELRGQLEGEAPAPTNGKVRKRRNG